MDDELIHWLALGLVPGIGDVQARLLVQQAGSATAVFGARQHLLEQIEGIGMVRAKAIRQFRDFSVARNELRFLDQNGAALLRYGHPGYPRRLLHCADAPFSLFYKGRADLDNGRIVGFVGTRNYTDYGRRATERLVEELSTAGCLIVSGLAVGIDAFAHRAALKQGLPTVGVVGHGLDRVYPHIHAPLARDLLEKDGGLLSEFFSGTLPDRHHFPLRNRIVAGLCDALVVVETGVKGGSMITARLADSYHRDVFAVPGRTTDAASTGCNRLIQQNKAFLLSDAQQLLDVMGWSDRRPAPPKQPVLFANLSPQEEQVLQQLKERPSLHVDELTAACGLHSSTVAAILLNLELNGLVQSLPGKRYGVLGN